MGQQTINQRVKFLLDKYQLSVRGFSELIGQKPANTQNYVGARASMPGADYLQSIVEHFEDVNPVWLLTGRGEPFLDGSAPTQNQTNISGSKNIVASGKGGKAIQNNYTLADCEKERDTLRADLDSLAKQVELLNGHIKMQETIIQGKDEMLDLLRGGFNRPN